MIMFMIMTAESALGVLVQGKDFMYLKYPKNTLL